MIRGVAFDLEGTAIDVERAHHCAHLALARELGLALSLEDAVERLPHFIGGPDEAVVAELVALLPQASRLGIDLDRLVARKQSIYRGLLARLSIAPRSGFLAFLDAANGLPTAIGSVTRRRESAHLLRASGLDRLFRADRIVVREDVGAAKPAPDVFLETARLMGIAPQEQLVFEDSPGGVRAARAAGSPVVAMPTLWRPSVLAALEGAGALVIYAGWSEVDLGALLRRFA